MIKLSYDEARTWSVSKTLEPGPSAYSDLAVGATERSSASTKRRARTASRLTDGSRWRGSTWNG